MKALLLVALAVVTAAAPAAPARAQELPYAHGDPGGFWDILPPGNDGTVNAVEAAAFLGAGQRPPYSSDQVAPYRDLLYASPGLGAAGIDRYFFDNTFGVRPEDVRVRYSPRSDVVVVRDRQTNRPAVYGATRAGTMFGAGYVAAEDRLFMMDILRHTGRAQLSSFIGGSEGYRSFDRDQWAVAPYREEELAGQIDRIVEETGEAGLEAKRDILAYVDGINTYIAQARSRPELMPAEYAAIGRTGPDDFTLTDVLASASVIGAQLGKCDCLDLEWTVLLESLQERFGRRRGRTLWEGLRAHDDPEAATTVQRRRFPWQPVPRRPRRGSVALPDRGSLEPVPVVKESSGARGGALSPLGRGIEGALRSIMSPHDMSNALLVSARESASGRPLAVFGPQAGFFTVEPFILQELHGPGIEASGMGVVGVSFFIGIGRGRDYAWSATTAHNDVIDTYAVPLCEPAGKRPTLESMHYEFRGECLPIDVLEQTNSWRPNPIDPTPPGSETLRAERTKLGLVTHRATIRGRPHAFTRLRSTYMHEIDGLVGLLEMNDPSRITGPRAFQRAAAKVGYAFNWFYVDDRSIAYINGGANNPVRPRGIDPLLPVSSRFPWVGFDPETNTARYARFGQMPQVVDQAYIVNWNNRQARGHTWPDAGRTSVHRSDMLERRLRREIRGRRKAELHDLVDIMEDAATVDLRGERMVPLLLRVLGTPRDRALRDAVEDLRAWSRDGAHRIDRDRDGVYEHNSAVMLMDAWWPRLMHAVFEPGLGKKAFARLRRVVGFDNEPNYRGQHRGSAYEAGWYGYLDKDLRTLLGRRVRGRYPVRFCGDGRLRRCRRVVAASLREALAADQAAVYASDPGCSGVELERLPACYDEIRFQVSGAVAQDPIPFQNRPTYQQVVEVGRRAGP